MVLASCIFGFRPVIWQYNWTDVIKLKKMKKVLLIIGMATLFSCNNASDTETTKGNSDTSDSTSVRDNTVNKDTGMKRDTVMIDTGRRRDPTRN